MIHTENVVGLSSWSSPYFQDFTVARDDVDIIWPDSVKRNQPMTQSEHSSRHHHRTHLALNGSTTVTTVSPSLPVKVVSQKLFTSAQTLHRHTFIFQTSTVGVEKLSLVIFHRTDWLLPTTPAKKSYLPCSFLNKYFMNSLNKTEEESGWAEQVRRDREADLGEPGHKKEKRKTICDKKGRQEIEIKG